MSFASISCCRGPTKADIESAWRPGATAERIGSRGIRPRQELATASMVPGRVALGEALINMQRTCFALAAYSTPMLRGLAGGELHSAYNPCVYTPVPPQRILCKPRRLPRFRCLNTPQHPSQRRNPSRRSPPSPTPLPTMPRVSLASRHQFFTGAHKRPTRPFDCDACTYMLGALSRAVPERVVRRITLAAMMYKMSAGQFDLVYNSLSFTLASMMAP